MATSLLTLLDDIALLLDDIALMSKMAARKAAATADDVAVLSQVAAKKTAGVLGDDLALNAQQVSGVEARRELPVVWAVARGSLVNKAILVPAALAISAWAPWLVVPLLMVGGAYLCYEGFEKVAHRFLHSRAERDAEHAELTRTLADPAADLVAIERDKIRGAVRTDFILSAEIIVISLGTVAAAPFATRLGVLVSIALVMTVGVYGLVAGIVKLDDFGLWLARQRHAAARAAGRAIVAAAPWLMKALSVAGTAAMFLVGGGILVHGIPPLHHAIDAALQGLSGGLQLLAAVGAEAVVGIVAGAFVLGAVAASRRLFARRAGMA